MLYIQITKIKSVATADPRLKLSKIDQALVVSVDDLIRSLE